MRKIILTLFLPFLFLSPDGRAQFSQMWNSPASGLLTSTDWTAFNGKQAALVSGTNIKTVNGNNLLGSGDVVISSAVAWGAITGTLSSQTDLQNSLNLKANLASPSFTGTVSGITATMVGLGSVDNTSDAGKPVSTAQQTALDLKGNITSQTFVTPNIGAASMTSLNKYTLPDASATILTNNAAVTVAQGGTGTGTASITAFNNITGFSAAGTTGTTSTNLVFSTSPTFVTPVLGAATGTSLAATGAVTSSGGGIGYATGAGGTVTQATSRTTTVVNNKLCGTITMFSAAQAAQAIVTFTLTNSFIAATDILIVQHISATNGGAWNFSVVCGAGSATISITNLSSASITSATPLRFIVIKAVTG